MINFIRTVKTSFFLIIFIFNATLLYGFDYKITSNLYSEYLNKAYSEMDKKPVLSAFVINTLCDYNSKYVKINSKYVKCDIKGEKKATVSKKHKKINLSQYPLLDLKEKYKKIKLNEERFKFINKIKNQTIKDYFELRYYQRIDNQTAYIKKLKSIKNYDIFLTLPHLIDYLKYHNRAEYKKAIKNIYKNNKENLGVLLYYEHEFNENDLNTDLINNYFLYNYSHADFLISKYQKENYKKAINKIIKILKIQKESLNLFLKVLRWNYFFKNDKNHKDILKLFPKLKNKPEIRFFLLKTSFENMIKFPQKLLNLNLKEARSLYNSLFSTIPEYTNERIFFKEELNSMSADELNYDKILKSVKKISINNDTSYKIEQKEAIYFSNKAKNLIYEAAYIDKEEEITIKNAIIYKKNGNIIKINDYETLIPYEYEGLYSDMRLVRFYLDDLIEKGDVFLIDYTIKSTKYRNYFKKKLSFVEKIKPASDIIKFKYTIQYPESLKLSLSYNKKFFSETQKSKNKIRKIILKAQNLKTFKKEKFYRFNFKKQPYIAFSNFKNYKEVNKWFFKIIFDKKYTLDKKYKDYFKNLATKNNLKSQEEKIKFFYDYILKNIHYVGIELGIHSYKPYSPNTVFENKYGDCKDRALLFSKIMEIFNIKTNITLVSTFDFGEFDFSLPSYAYFNHAIIYIPQIDTYLDLTDKDIPFKKLPPNDINSTILILDRKSDIKKLPLKINPSIKKIFTYIPDSNDFIINHKEIYTDIYNSNFKIDFPEIQKIKYETYLSNYYEETLKLISYKNYSNNKNSKIQEFNYKRYNKSEKNISIISLFQKQDLFEKKLAPSNKRSNDYSFNLPPSYEYEIKFKNLKNIYSFEDKKIENIYFKAKLFKKENTVYFLFNLKVKNISKEETANFKNKLRELDNILRKKYCLEFK